MLYAKIRKKKTIPSNVEKKWSYENNTSTKIILNKQNYGIVTIVIILIIFSVTLCPKEITLSSCDCIAKSYHTIFYQKIGNSVLTKCRKSF